MSEETAKMLKIIVLISLVIIAIPGISVAQNVQPKKEILAAKYVYVPGGAGGQELHLVPKVGTALDTDLKNFLLGPAALQLAQISSANPTNTVALPVNTLFKSRGPDFDSSAPNVVVGVSIDLSAPLPVGYYILTIPTLRNYAANPSDYLIFEVETAPASLEVKPTIEASLDGSRDKIRIKSDSQNKTFKANATPSIEIEKYSLSSDNKTVVKSLVPIDTETLNVQGQAVTGSTTSDEVTLRLEKPLPKTQISNLAVRTGITDASDVPIAGIKGKIAAVELPKDPDKLTVDGSASYSGATGTGPSWDVSFKYNAQEKLPVNGWFFQPKFELALGFGKSETENSIVLDLPFRKTLIAGRLTRFELNDPAFAGKNLLDVNSTIVPNYYGWTQTPVEKGKFYFYVGPKFEADRKLKRINVLGSTRLEFRSYRLMASISQKRQYLTGSTYGVSKEVAQQVEINNGNSFIPFAAFDFGGNVREQAVEVEDRGLLETIPRSAVARVYSGFNNTLETTLVGRPVNLTIEEKVFYFLAEERVGGTRDALLGNTVVKVIDIRKVKGFQHFGSLSLDFFFSPLRRYSLNITYENGRKAPDFNYLNKVTAGIKVTY